MVGTAPLRIGILGAAAIAPNAVIRPARHVPGVEVDAIAARDRGRAESFATRHGIGRVHDRYDDVLDDPAIDAVYIPLPNGLHGTWTTRALAAGKHVLCEKPFTANADEAARVAEAARGSGLVVMEAFHWRYHPMNVRLLQRIADGDLGPINRLEGAFSFPLLKRNDIRWSRELAGGSLMDAGCYPVNMVRAAVHAVGGGEPRVVSARGAFTGRGVDRVLHAELAWDDGPVATVRCGMFSPTRPVAVHLTITGAAGSVRIRNPLLPQLGGRAVYRIDGRRVVDRAERSPSYDHQLVAFRNAIIDGTPFPSTVDDAVANMTVIDDCYRAAGVTPLSPTPT